MSASCNTIILNVTAARSSGALSILNQFVSHIPPTDNNQYYLFVDTNYKEVVQAANIKYIHIDTRSWRRRIWWDEYGFRQYVKKKGLQPSLIISLQNTRVKFDKSIPQLIYYHQSLALFPKKWSLFKRQETLFFLYKNIYSWFVSRSINENVFFVVQIPSIKEAFLKRFSIPKEKIYVIPPEVQTIDYGKVFQIQFADDKRHFIYPATPYLYKNHALLLRALRVIKERNTALFQRIKLHFTLKENNPLGLKELAGSLGVEEAIVFEGVLPFQQLLSYYKSMDALLFPSYIETFGLPLLEAAGAGIAIVASDLPYAHDVVGGYEGVSFLNYEDAEAWASAIESLCEQEKKTYSSFHYPTDRGNWNDFFALIEKLKIQN